MRRDGRVQHLVLGYFDPYYAEHARALKTISAEHQVIVAVCDPTGGKPLMPARARAEVIAAIASVDAVIVENTSMLRELRPDVVSDFRSNDAAWARQVRQRVHEKPVCSSQ